MLNLHTKKNGSLCQSLNFHFLAYNKIRKSIKHNTRVLAAFQKTSMKCWNMKPKGRELSRWVEIKEALVLLCSVMRPVTVMYCSIRSELVMLERITFVMMHWIKVQDRKPERLKWFKAALSIALVQVSFITVIIKVRWVLCWSSRRGWARPLALRTKLVNLKCVIDFCCFSNTAPKTRLCTIICYFNNRVPLCLYIAYKTVVKERKLLKKYQTLKENSVYSIQVPFWHFSSRVLRHV